MQKHVNGFLGFLGYHLGSSRQLFISTKETILYTLLTLGIFLGVLMGLIYGVYMITLSIL